MLPVRRILCPTDFSNAAGAAVDAAVELSAHFNAELILLHVVPPVPAPMPGPVGQVQLIVPTLEVEKYRKELEAHYKENLSSLADRFSEKVACRSVVTTGLAADEITRLAHEEDADLIVIATHGRTGWRHMVFGSVAERVVRTASHPVLVVQSPHSEEPEGTS